MLEVASMAVHVSQMTDEQGLHDCFNGVTQTAARILNLPDYGLAPGNPANLVVLQARSAIDAIRLRPARLYVLRHGRILSRTEPRLSHLYLTEEKLFDLSDV